jgi:low affinity Fe/Cu permease
MNMNNKIDKLIRQYKKEPEVKNQISILVAARQEIDQLHKTLAKTIP